MCVLPAFRCPLPMYKGGELSVISAKAEIARIGALRYALADCHPRESGDRSMESAGSSRSSPWPDAAPDLFPTFSIPPPATHAEEIRTASMNSYSHAFRITAVIRRFCARMRSSDVSDRLPRVGSGIFGMRLP